MNGMQKKAERLKRERLFTRDNIPRNAADWTVEDWRDLHRALEKVKRLVGARHKRRNDS